MADEQVKYGSIVVLHKDGPSPRPHSLKLGPTTIGTSSTSDIRVKTILSRTVQCIISTKDNGLVTIENKSKAHPVFLNGAILKALEVLIDGDKFEVAGRAFQYINDKQKNRKDLIKILEKSSTKRQTAAAAMMSSSSKIPVSLNAGSRIPVKKKRSLSLSESKENKRTSVARLCATASTTKRTTSLVSPGHGLRKVLFDESSKDQCGPSPFLALNMRTRRSQSLTDRPLSTQSDLTSSRSSSVKLDEGVNVTKSPARSPSLSLKLPEAESKPKTPKTLSVSSTRKSMKKISEECGIENETIDLIDFDISNVEQSPLTQNEEAQITCDAKVSTPQNALKSPQSNTRVARSKSCTPMKSPIKQTSTTTVEINDKSHELSQSLSEVEDFVSPQKVDEDNLQEEDEIPSPNYEVISPNKNGFGSTTLVEPLNSGDLSTQPVTDDDSTFFTPADISNNSINESDSFKLQLETSTASSNGQSPARSPTKNRNSTPKASVLMAGIPSKNSRKCSSSSSDDVNEAAEETLVSLNHSNDSNLVSVAEFSKDLSALEPSTPKWTDENKSTAVFTRSGRKCSLPRKFREFQSISSTPKSAIKKRIVENVIMETSNETTVSASEASFASTADSTSFAVDTSNFEITEDVLNQGPVGGASRAKSLGPIKAKTQLRNKSLPPLLQTVDCEESVSSILEMDLSNQQSVISISDVSQDDSVQSDANNSVIFKPVSTPPTSNPPASSYKTPPSVQISDSQNDNNTKSVRFSETYVPKPRTPITRQKIRSLTPASAKTKRLYTSMPLTTIGLSSVAENLEDSVSQKTEDNISLSTEETFTPETPSDGRKSVRMSSRKSLTTPKEASIVHISDAEASILSESGDAETEESNDENVAQKNESEGTPQTAGGDSTRKSNRMSVRKSSKEVKLIDISDAGSTIFGNDSCVSQLGETEEEKQEMVDKVLQTPSDGRKSVRSSSRRPPTTIVRVTDAEANSFSEKVDAEKGSQRKITPEETPRTPSGASVRKSNRMLTRETPKEIIDISNADGSMLFGDESCVAQSGETEKEKQETADKILQTPSDCRKSVRMSSRKQPTTPKDASIVQISDAEESIISEHGDVETEGNDTQKKGIDADETHQTSGNGSTRKSNRMSPRKTPKQISLIDNSESVVSTLFGDKSCVAQPGETEEKQEMTDEAPQTPSDSRKSVRMSSRKQPTTPKEASIVYVSNEEASIFSENKDAETEINEPRKKFVEPEDKPQTSGGCSPRKSIRMSARKTSKEVSLIDISDADDSTLFGGESCVAQLGETEENKQEMADKVLQTPSDGRKSFRMSSRKQSTTPREASIVQISDAEESIISENGDVKTKGNELQKKEIEAEKTPQTSGGGSTRKSNRMSTRKTPKQISLIDNLESDLSALFGDESSVVQPGETEDEQQEMTGKALQTPSDVRKSIRMSSRKQPTTPKDASIVYVPNEEASIFSESDDAETEENEQRKKLLEPEGKPQTPGGGLTRKSNRMSAARKTPKKISLINISDACSKSFGGEGCVSQSGETEEEKQETPDEVTQTPSAILKVRKSFRMSSRKPPTTLNEASVASVKGDEESNGENEVKQTPQTLISNRKSAGMSSRKSSKTAQRTSVEQMSIVNVSSRVEEPSSFSEELDEKSDDDKMKKTPQTSLSSRKSAPMSSRKSRQSSIISVSNLGDTIAADHNYSLSNVETTSNNEEKSVTKQQTPQASSSPRKSVQRSSRTTPIISDVAAAPKADDSVINLIEKTPLSNVRHFRAKSHTPGIVKVHTARKRSLPLLQKTLKKAAALIANTPASSAKSLSKAETSVTAKSSEKGQTPARKSLNKRLSAGVVSETVEGSPVTAFVQQTVSQETLAARRSSRMSKKKSVGGERTPIQLPRGTKRARDTPATIQSRKRRKLDQSSEDENASMNSFCEEPSTYETPKSERLHNPQKSPLNDLTEVSGLKRLMKTPKYQKSPLNDLSDVKGVKKLLATPKIAKSPANDLTKITGVKRLMKTPKPVKSPLNDLREVKGVKKLMRTPRVQKSPKNDLQHVAGVKKMFASPITLPASPLNDLTNVDGVKELMQLQKVPRNDLTDVEGVETLFAEPQKKSDEVFDSLLEKKQMKTYQRKSYPSHVLQRVNDNKAQRASSADQSSCSSRVHQWVEASQQHFEKIKQSKEVNVESSKSVETAPGTENTRATPLRTSRGKLPSRYLETDYVFPKVVTPKIQITKVDESPTTASINKLANEEIVPVTELSKKTKAADENAVTMDHLKVPQRVSRKRNRSSSERKKAVLKSKKTEGTEKTKSDGETVSQKVARKRRVRDTTSASIEKVLKITAKKNAAESGNSESDETPPSRSTRKTAKEKTLPEDAPQKSVKNKRIANKNVADPENEEIVSTRSTRKAAKKETFEVANVKTKDAPLSSVQNKRMAKKIVADSENEEIVSTRSTRKAAKTETLEVAKVKTKDAPLSPVQNKRMAKKSVADSENEQLAAPRFTRKAAKKDTLKDANHEPEDAPQRSVKNIRMAKKNVASYENEEMPPPRSTRTAKKDILAEDATQKSVKNKRKATYSENEDTVPPRSARKAAKKETLKVANAKIEDAPLSSGQNKRMVKKSVADSENEELAAPRSTRRGAKKETLQVANHEPEDAPQRSVKNKKPAKKNVASSENEEMPPPRSTRKAAKKDPLPEDAPQSSVKNKRMAKKNVADSENAEVAAPRSTRKAAKKETLKVANSEPIDVPQRSVNNKKIAKKNVVDSENEEIVAPRSTRKAGRKGTVGDINNEHQDAPQQSTRKRKLIDNAVDSAPLKRRKQEVEDLKKKTAKSTEAKSAVVDQQKSTASSKTKKESEKVSQPSQKTRATRKQAAEQKDSSSKTAINIKVQTAPQPKPTRQKLPTSTRSTRSSRK